MIAAMDLTNLLYVVGAIVAATLVSAFLLLRHRRPRSVDAGIESFSRELKALQPERREPGVTVVNRTVPTGPPGRPGDGEPRPALRRGATGRGGPVARMSGTIRPGPAVTPFAVLRPAIDPRGGTAEPARSDEASAPSPDRENDPG
jgi:hypothetical protein